MRLSYSTLELLNTCERKFEIERLIEGRAIREETEHLAFGRAFEAGVTSYLLHQDQERAIFETWLAYWPELQEGVKTIPSCIIALQTFFPELDNILMDWEPVSIQGKDPSQLNFKLWLDKEKNDYYVGYIDLILKSRLSDRYATLEIKTTGSTALDIDPLYKNSNQAVGYSIVVDHIAGEHHSSFDIIYCIAQIGKGFKVIPHVKTYPKTALDRLNWFFGLKMDYERILHMKSLKIFPSRGGSCMNFNKPCVYFGVCDLHSLGSHKTKEEPDLIDYDFTYNLEDIIKYHLERALS